MSDQRTIYDKILTDEVPAWKVWESQEHLALLTPFPNTRGLTIVIPKQKPGDYVFALPDEDYVSLMRATRVVARILERAFDVSRVAMVFEGTGVPHVHAKLIPLHGPLGSQTGVWSKEEEFFPEYVGYISTVEGPRLADEELDAIRDRIRRAAAAFS